MLDEEEEAARIAALKLGCNCPPRPLQILNPEIVSDEEEMQRYIASLGAVTPLGQGWSTVVNGHRHHVNVLMNPDTVVVFFQQSKGHIHVISVPVADVVAADGVITSSVDVAHQHQIVINVKKLST